MSTEDDREETEGTEYFRSAYERFQETVEQVPPSVRKNLEAGIAGVSVIAKGTYEMRNTAPLKTLHQCLTSSKSLSEQDAIKLMDRLKHLKPIQENRAPLTAAVQSETVAKESLQQCSKVCLEKVANTALGWSVGLSLFSIVLEGVVLCTFWFKLREAKEFAGSGFQAAKESIAAKVRELEEKVNAFALGIDLEQIQNMNTSQKFIFYMKVVRRRDEINKVIRGIVDEIDALERQVTTRKNTLKSFCGSSLSAATAQGIQCASLSVTTGIFAAAANPILAGVAIGAIAGHFIVTAARLALWKLASDTAKTLEEKLQELAVMRVGLQVQQDKLDDCFRELQTCLGGEDLDE